MTNACGVDFGTSNSTVGLIRPGHPILLPLEDGKTTLPSVVFFNADDHATTFGRAALADYLSGYEGRLMRSLKSLLGTSLMDGQTEVQGRALKYRDLLREFIVEMKRRAEAAAGQALQRAVLGRPVHFVDDDQDADRLAERTLGDIALDAGFQDICFQYEPIAAAFDYESRITREELVLIADIGGGTSDFSLVRLSPSRVDRVERREDILANGGVHIGGTDFDKYLSLASAMPLLGFGTRLISKAEVPSSYYFNLSTWHTINLVYTRKVWRELEEVCRDAEDRGKLNLLLKLVDQRDGHWLAMKTEEAKIALSESEEISMSLDRLDKHLTLPVLRRQFDAAVDHLVEGVAQTVRSLLASAGIAADRVDTVFFTGGSSGVRTLRARIAAMFPAAGIVEGDLFGSIGSGLALDAHRRFG
ncbi:Hsp70 family protein [Noviherbaspirillum galbum]|uniref:Hsp70 family protein n=1 Tax=Noviherbaspirillum galbum TaxID=2709383 RepID=A0A6B3SLT5_9BURK|nr:Hsp70 family protein [Noviherbaspirillum galbum]NEX61761.1 Hsp70 family protein [Noviherbaspirillum galbum]